MRIKPDEAGMTRNNKKMMSLTKTYGESLTRLGARKNTKKSSTLKDQLLNTNNDI